MTTTTRRLNGPTVRVIRELHGLGLRTFAQRIEVDPGFLTRLETGARQCSPAVMHKIANGLGVHLEVISYPVALSVMEVA
jgi:transcriptional regulator with XRE-family HTH domain